MNQASRKSWLVPVLPAAAQPRQARAARGARHQRLMQHRVHHADVTGIDDAAERRLAAVVERRFGVGGADALDDMRRHREATVAKVE